MAWQGLRESWDTQWGHIYYKIFFDTTRSGADVAVRYRIEYSIQNKYYFGYPIKVQTFMDSQQKEDIQMKGTSPNTGSGSIETEWYWQNKGYSDNNIWNCRVNIYTTLGGTAGYDTGWNTLIAPQGAVASTINNNIDFTIGNGISINISDPTNLGYNYTLYLYINNVADVVVMNTTSKNFTWNFTQDEINRIYSKVPNQNQAGTTIFLATYLNGQHIGTNSRDGICYVANSNPTFDGFTYKDISNAINVTKNNQNILQNKSEIQLTCLNVTTKNCAIFSTFTVEVGGSIFNKTEKVFSIGNINEETTIIVKAVDSRGNSATSSKTVKFENGNILLIPYEEPEILEYMAMRNNAGTASAVTLAAKAKVAKIIKDNNQIIVQQRFKELPSGAWGTYTNVTYTVDINGNISISTPAGNFDISKTYSLELKISDYFGGVPNEYIILSAKMLLSLRKDIIGINKIPIPGSGALQINGGLNVDNGMVGYCSSIAIWIYTYDTIPIGWMKLEGQAISRNTYSNLFKLISTTFGAGDGSTTFNVPDFRGKVPVGFVSGDTDFGSIGKTGGERQHALNSQENGPHNHGQDGHNHSMGHNHRTYRGAGLSVNGGQFFVTDSNGPGYGAGYDGQYQNWTEWVDPGTSWSQPGIWNSGDGKAHNNLQPYISFIWIIKY